MLVMFRLRDSDLGMARRWGIRGVLDFFRIDGCFFFFFSSVLVFRFKFFIV